MQPTQKIEYIDGEMKNGLKIDWSKIHKEYLKLKCPKDKYQVNLPWDSANLFLIFSERDSGKSTNVILHGLIAYVMYGIKIEWLRQLDTMVKPTNSEKMFETIKQYDYIKKITKGKYKDIFYYRKELFLCNIQDGEKGRPKDIDDKPFFRFNSIEDWANIKSNYTSPYGDFIVFDEFQTFTNKEEEFNKFFQVISTIKRERISTKILMLGNTLTPYNYYFREMDLTKYIVKMQPNQKQLIKTRLGMNVYIEWFNRLNENNKQSEKDRQNELQYYGFDGLNAIIGGQWEIKQYPHITRELDNRKEVLNNFYLKFQLFNLNLKLCYEETIGFFVYVRPCSEKTMEYANNNNEIIFVDYPPTKYNEIYGIGKGFTNISNLWRLLEMNKFLYSTNDIGEMLNEFILQFS